MTNKKKKHTGKPGVPTSIVSGSLRVFTNLNIILTHYYTRFVYFLSARLEVTGLWQPATASTTWSWRRWGRSPLSLSCLGYMTGVSLPWRSGADETHAFITNRNCQLHGGISHGDIILPWGCVSGIKCQYVRCTSMTNLTSKNLWNMILPLLSWVRKLYSTLKSLKFLWLTCLSYTFKIGWLWHTK